MRRSVAPTVLLRTAADEEEEPMYEQRNAFIDAMADTTRLDAIGR